MLKNWLVIFSRKIKCLMNYHTHSISWTKQFYLTFYFKENYSKFSVDKKLLRPSWRGCTLTTKEPNSITKTSKLISEASSLFRWVSSLTCNCIFSSAKWSSSYASSLKIPKIRLCTCVQIRRNQTVSWVCTDVLDLFFGIGSMGTPWVSVQKTRQHVTIVSARNLITTPSIK